MIEIEVDFYEFNIMGVYATIEIFSLHFGHLSNARRYRSNPVPPPRLVLQIEFIDFWKVHFFEPFT
jgi:hypothetical protein